MYQPYLRGKQYELIGLEEFVKFISNDQKNLFTPIIEPVRNNSRFEKTLLILEENKVNFSVIINPQVGDFLEEEDDCILKIISKTIPNYKNFQCGILLDMNTNIERVLSLIKKYKEFIPAFTLIHLSIINKVDTVLTLFEAIAPVKFNTIDCGRINQRYINKLPKDTVIKLNDYFESQKRNVDYISVGSSYFTDDYLYYAEEGCVGYADFTSIGSEYSDSGGMSPYAVAIHLSYLDKSKVMYIKHLVSDSNADRSNPAGKYLEIKPKFGTWYKTHNPNTIGANMLQDYFMENHYPGLGVLKKISMLNHMELILNILLSNKNN